MPLDGHTLMTTLESSLPRVRVAGGRRGWNAACAPLTLPGAAGRGLPCGSALRWDEGRAVPGSPCRGWGAGAAGWALLGTADAPVVFVIPAQPQSCHLPPNLAASPNGLGRDLSPDPARL